MRNVPGTYFWIFLFLASCANQVTPGGGERDTKAPVVEKEEPENYTRNFHAREIHVTFDEYIQVNELAKQLVVSPPLPQAPVARVKKKTLIVELTDSLLPNTTYTLNFGNAIGDLNEGNAIPYSNSGWDILDPYICFHNFKRL